MGRVPERLVEHWWIGGLVGWWGEGRVTLHVGMVGWHILSSYSLLLTYSFLLTHMHNSYFKLTKTSDTNAILLLFQSLFLTLSLLLRPCSVYLHYYPASGMIQLHLYYGG